LFAKNAFFTILLTKIFVAITTSATNIVIVRGNVENLKTHLYLRLKSTCRQFAAKKVLGADNAKR